jgi:CBS domain-containing protein
MSDPTVSDLMTTDVKTMRPDQTVEEAADVLAQRRIGAVPVVDDAGKVIGLLRDEDLIISEARLHMPTVIHFLGADFALPSALNRFEHELKQVAGGTVGDVMSTEFPTIGPDNSVEDLATMMHESDVTHVPVVDADTKLVGIVARGDLIGHLSRTT